LTTLAKQQTQKVKAGIFNNSIIKA